jgi:hypothetical protein
MTTSGGLDKATFVQDETLKRAYVRSIEVIGEAVKQLPDSLRHQVGCRGWGVGLRRERQPNGVGKIAKVGALKPRPMQSS